MLHCYGLRIPEPVTDILRRELSKQLSLPSCSQILVQLRPCLDASTSQDVQEWRSEILISRIPPSEDWRTHRAINARLHNLLQFQQVGIQLIKDRTEPDSAIFEMLRFGGMYR
jgi:hypothetical protein